MSSLLSLTTSLAPARLLAAAVLAAAITLGIAAPAHAGTRVVIAQPAAHIVSGSIVFSARSIGARARAIVFRVDGRRRWTSRGRPFRLQRAGVLDTWRLSNGPHVLSVDAVYAGGRQRIATKRITVLNFAAHAVRKTTTPPSIGTSLWSGDFQTGDLSRWGYVQDCPNSISVAPAPLRPGQNAAKLTVTDQDIGANCPTLQSGTNPNAFLVSPAVFHENDNVYIHFSTFFPATFPTLTSAQWFQIAEIYGKPFGGSPSIGIDITGNRIKLSRDSTHSYDTPWTAPTDIHKGTAWEDIVLHVVFSTDPTIGLVELWYNGVKQTFTNGTTRLPMATLVPGVNWTGPGGTNSLYLDQYRSGRTPLGPITIYHAAAKVATTYTAATT